MIGFVYLGRMSAIQGECSVTDITEPALTKIRHFRRRNALEAVAAMFGLGFRKTRAAAMVGGVFCFRGFVCIEKGAAGPWAWRLLFDGIAFAWLEQQGRSPSWTEAHRLGGSLALLTSPQLERAA